MDPDIDTSPTAHYHTKADFQLEGLLIIMDVMDKYDFTIRTFLIALFTSENERCAESVTRFYSKDNPGFFLDFWFTRLRHRNQQIKLVQAAWSLVQPQAQRDLKSLASLVDLRCPASSLTSQKIDSFCLSGILQILQENASVLYNVLFGLTNDDDTSTRPPTTIVPTILSMLLIHWNGQCNLLQLLMGLYLYSGGAGRKTLEVLSKLGLSVSYSSIMRALKALTDDAMSTVRGIAISEPWYLVYDNINIASRRSDQRITNTDTFENGATATIIVGEKLDRPSLTDNPYIKLSFDDLLPTALSDQRMKEVCRYYFIDVLRKQSKGYQDCSVPQLEQDPLTLKKTPTFPLRSMKINQATVEGNISILETVVQELQLPHTFFDNGKRIVIAGDQLTISRIRTIKSQRWDDIPGYYRMEWAIPVVQLFHLQMLLSNTILRTHYGSVRTQGSLAHHAKLLGRNRVTLDKPDFHAVDQLLRHCFIATALRVWELRLGNKDLDVVAKQMEADDLDTVVHFNSKDVAEQCFASREVLDSLGSVASKNAFLFLRDMTMYMELGAAIKAGDIGRIEEVLKWITIIFQAGSTKNYGYELLRLHCELRHAWDTETKRAVMSSLLVNTCGETNRWIPADLYQEHNNLLTKVIYAAKGSNASWELLAESISANIHTFARIAKRLESQYKISKNKSWHADVSYDEDIKRILRSLREHSIFEDSCALLPPPVKNLFDDGLLNLSDGRIEDFIQNHLKPEGASSPYDNMDIGQNDSEDEVDYMDVTMEHEHGHFDGAEPADNEMSYDVDFEDIDFSLIEE